MAALALTIHPSFFCVPPAMFVPLGTSRVPPDGHSEEHTVVGTGLQPFCSLDGAEGATYAPCSGLWVSPATHRHEQREGQALLSQLVFPQQLTLPLPLLVGEGEGDLDLSEVLDALPQLRLQRLPLLAQPRGHGAAPHPVLLHRCMVALTPLPHLLHLLQLLQGLGEVQGVGASGALLGGFWLRCGARRAGVILSRPGVFWDALTRGWSGTGLAVAAGAGGCSVVPTAGAGGVLPRLLALPGLPSVAAGCRREAEKCTRVGDCTVPDGAKLGCSHLGDIAQLTWAFFFSKISEFLTYCIFSPTFF